MEQGMERVSPNTFRTPVAVTWAVWKALFLREAISRLFARRMAWAWLILEPVVHIAFLVFLFMVIRVREVGGIETPVWLMVGLLTFFMFKRPATQAMNAVSAYQALFAYRQVRPVDPVLTRAALEGFLMVLISIVVATGAILFGFSFVPADPLSVLVAFFGAWFIGLGFGLITSVIQELIPELGKVISMMMGPLYILSGVIFPINAVPPPSREWILYNPLVHVLEAARLGFAPYYHAIPELDLGYVYRFALGMVFLGLAMHLHFAMRLATR